MGILRWMRGDGSTTGAMGAGLGELDAFFSPGKRQQLENLQTLEMLADDEAAGAPPRAVDLVGNTAVIRVPRAAQPETGATPDAPASSRS